MLRFLHLNACEESLLRTRIVPSTRRIVPEVEAAIDLAWRETLMRPGVNLFDGPVCRLEALLAEAGGLTVDLSQTTYRILVGTNFANPQFADVYGPDVMANPVGVSCGVITSDNQIMMGRRNRTVAYYPDRIHPFAGSLEVRSQIDLFANVRRELREEIGLQPPQLTNLICLGVAEDSLLRHPEIIFAAWTTLSRAQIEQQLDAQEHHDTWCVSNDAKSVAGALETESDLTPIARAILLMLGGHEFGNAWFDANAKPYLD